MLADENYLSGSARIGITANRTYRASQLLRKREV
jgi:hypothetical protein